MEVDLVKVKPIFDWATPVTKSTVQNFRGLTTFLICFVWNFHQSSIALNKLNFKFQYSSAVTGCFIESMQDYKFCILRLLKFKKVYASNVGIGVLSQDQTIEFFSEKPVK